LDHPASSIIILIILLILRRQRRREGVYISFTTGIQGRGWRITNQLEAY